jgi:RNA polymerase sigma-70 factor (ECF subfamily)
MADPRTDEELLAVVDGEPEAFAVFYGRHVRPLLAYLLRRTGDAELAADLCAETFAAALEGLHRFDARRGPAVAWLYGIARRLLGHAVRRGVVEDRARRRLGMAPLELTDAAIEQIEAEAGEVATAALDALPADQREAVQARIVDERDYGDIARSTRTSEAVVRKRVSRGLAGLRARMKENRA